MAGFLSGDFLCWEVGGSREGVTQCLREGEEEAGRTAGQQREHDWSFVVMNLE